MIRTQLFNVMLLVEDGVEFTEQDIKEAIESRFPYANFRVHEDTGAQ